MLGTFVNMAAVLVGGGIGLLLKGRLSSRVTENLLRVMGLCVCVIGLSGAIQGDAMLLVAALASGTLLGEALDLDGRLNRFGLWIQAKMSGKGGGSQIAEGFVTATLLFCVGAMAIVGSIDSGLRGDHSVIFTKSVIDGVSAMVFASALGAGVLLSGASILIYQGAIVLCASSLQSVLSPELITQVSAAGSVMILGLGLNMALEAKIKVANLLPAFLTAAGYYFLVLA
ncbi:MAG: DUF554 domain-containing protein [Gracilibacteraceae bacterium]|jgi:uncharacterized membrane protein YqgA involved in biofilm formation|nr:DUF554 domain-containing protein [Gracilibacteraceae bacterium]